MRRSFRQTQVGERGSIIILVMVTLLFTAAALVAFLDKAETDLLVDARAAQAARMRSDAYSALEVTLAVLQDFRVVDNNQLRSPSEGWGDPLGWAGWTPGDPSHTVEVSFQDESGKIPLIHADQTTLLNLFETPAYGSMAAGDAQKLIDGILGWMQAPSTPRVFRPCSPTTAFQSTLPVCRAPANALRSMQRTGGDRRRPRRSSSTSNAGPTPCLVAASTTTFSIFNFRNVEHQRGHRRGPGGGRDSSTSISQQRQSRGVASAGTPARCSTHRLQMVYQRSADLQVVTGKVGQLEALSRLQSGP